MVFGASSAGGAIRPTVGAAAPDVDLPTDTGGRWRLADHRGRTVIAIFHRHIH
ncbi:MAG: hypothetical protein AAFP84_11010 [Actinomycetota bacterium]